MRRAIVTLMLTVVPFTASLAAEAAWATRDSGSGTGSACWVTKITGKDKIVTYTACK